MTNRAAARHSRRRRFDDNWEISIPHYMASSEEIKVRVGRLGWEITYDYVKLGEPPTVIWIANGSLYFTADLTRKIDLQLPFVEVIKARSYQGTVSGPLELGIQGLDKNIVEGRHVLINDDILDTGQTLKAVLTEIDKLKPKSVQVCVLLVKDGKQIDEVKIEPKYVGFDIEDAFVVGYGLDLDGKYRNQTALSVPPEHARPGLGRARPRPPRGDVPDRPLHIADVIALLAKVDAEV